MDPSERGDEAEDEEQEERGDEADAGTEDGRRRRSRRRQERMEKVGLNRKRKTVRTVSLLVFVVAIVVLAAVVWFVMNPKEGNPTVVVETSEGTFEMELFMDKCPETAANFKSLVEQGFYDGLSFHRIVNTGSFKIIQGGDPKGDGSGGSGKNIDFEASAGALKHERGSLAMARSDDKNSASSQFYICGMPISSLDGEYAVFGKVTKGMDVVDAINALPTDPSNDRPYSTVLMRRVYIKGH